jgi:ribosomal protein L7/L12
MLYIKEIRDLLGISLEEAEEVFNEMVLDFSEATQEEFEREATFIYKICSNRR